MLPWPCGCGSVAWKAALHMGSSGGTDLLHGDKRGVGWNPTAPAQNMSPAPKAFPWALRLKVSRTPQALFPGWGRGGPILNFSSPLVTFKWSYSMGSSPKLSPDFPTWRFELFS